MIFVQGDFCSSLRGHLAPSGDILGFLGGSVVKNLPANAGDVGSISGSGRSPGEGDDNPLQHPWTEESGGLQSVESQKNWTGFSD